MINIIKYTEYPLQLIGYVAGTCWNAPTNDAEKNKRKL